MADEALPEITDTAEGQIATTEVAGAPENFIQRILADPQQRLFAIIGGVVLVIAIVAIMMMGGGKDENRGQLVNLVQELDQARAFEIIAKLKTVNIEAKVIPSEKPGEYIVQTYENAVETAYLNLSRTNLLQDEGYGLFDQSDWAASDYDKRIKLTRAINGDLSRIVSRMDGLRSAIVRVNVPEQQLFTEFQAPTTASVQIELDNEGDELSKSQVKSIVNVLRGYVPNLEKDKISIVDTVGNNYNTFRDDDESSTDDYIDELERVNKTIKKRIERYLDDVLGDEKYRVSVSASMSREKIQRRQTTYSDGAVGSRQIGDETLNSGGANVAGPGTSGGKNYKQSSTSETLYPSFEQQNVTYMPGRVTNVTVALAVDKSIPATMSLKQLQESVAAIVGPNTQAEHIKIIVTDLIDKGSPQAPTLAKGASEGAFFGLFKSGASFKDTLFSIFSIIGTILGLLIVGIIGLNFLGAASNQKPQKTVDQNLGSEFEDVLHEKQEQVNDFGEKKALEQQEALLKEMLNAQEEPVAAPAATQTAAPKKANNASEQKVEFEGLLNNFQSAAQNQPEILAQKIENWLEE